jgi:S1-C subfamily serine protease
MKAKIALSMLLLAVATTCSLAQTLSITKLTRETNGGESTETIVKKGQAARDFDIDAYIRDNKADNVSLDIMRTGTDEDRRVTINGPNAPRMNVTSKGSGNFEREVRDVVTESFNWAGDQVRELVGEDKNAYNYNDNYDYPYGDDRPFLGVEEDSDEEADAEGLVVEVVRCAAADRAGLRDNDLIISMDGTKINRWSDLTKFVQSAKVGDSVQIAYRRNGQPATTTAVLGKRSDSYGGQVCDPDNKKGFMGVSPHSDNKNKDGATVRVIAKSAAEKAGLRTGDVLVQINETPIRDFEDISDFMAYTKLGEVVRVAYQRDGQRNTVDVTLGEEQSWDWGNSWNSSQNWNFEAREKAACLGVYTNEMQTNDGKTGASVTNFTNASAAEDAGVRTGDLIIAINEESVTTSTSLWDLIAKYDVGDQVKVTYLRGGKERTERIALRACENTYNQVVITNTDDEGNGQERQFYTWNWGDNDREKLRERRTITIRKATEGDAPVASPAEVPTDRRLQLRAYKAFPNPSSGQVTIQFEAEKQPLTITLIDNAGRQLFAEEMNAFGGLYEQQFDLSEFAKGVVIVRIQQGGKVFVERIVVN